MPITDEVRALLTSMSASERSDALTLLQDTVFPHNLVTRGLARVSTSGPDSSSTQISRMDGGWAFGAKIEAARNDQIQVYISPMRFTADMVYDLATWAIAAYVGMHNGDVDAAVNTLRTLFPNDRFPPESNPAI